MSKVRISKYTFTNDVGGTEIVRRDTWVQVLEKLSNRYGGLFKGRLIEPKDIALARKQGTSGFKPADYEKYKNPEMLAEVEEAAANFDPTTVIFYKGDVETNSQ